MCRSSGSLGVSQSKCARSSGLASRRRRLAITVICPPIVQAVHPSAESPEREAQPSLFNDAVGFKAFSSCNASTFTPRAGASPILWFTMDSVITDPSSLKSRPRALPESIPLGRASGHIQPNTGLLPKWETCRMLELGTRCARRTNLNFLSKFWDFLVENEGTVMQIVACESAVLRQEGIDEVRPATPLGRIIWWWL